MKPLHRAVPLPVILSLLFTIIPAPARAVTTQQEIRAGQAEDEQITRSEVIENDPLLNAYVQSIANKLWLQVARKDVPYNIKVVKASDVNSFATEGGFVYIDEGLIDFVQSDDEFASVIGHETGHIERRHVITLNSKASILSLLLGIASIFSPFIYDFGNLIGATVMAKMSREDELEADRYGLQLMSRAGYDPDAMLTMMTHMGVLADAHSDLIDRYLQDHPDPKARIAHLLGYPELDPTVVTPQQRLVQALSDEERARYSYAAYKLSKILHSDPNDVEALLKLAQAQLALGLTSKSAQTLAQAAQAGSAQARALIVSQQTQLREIEVHRVELLRFDPNFSHLSATLADARQTEEAAAQQLQTRRDQARDQLKAVESRLQDIEYEMPNLGNIQVRPNSRMSAVMSNLAAMARAVNSGIDDGSQVITGVGSLEQNKESGLLRESRDILDEMAAPLAMHPVPDDSLAVFPSYSAMLQQLSLADGDMLRSIDASRASMTLMDQAVGDLDEFVRALDHSYVSFGDLAVPDYNGLVPRMSRVLEEFNAAATAASQAAQLYNMARSRQLSVRITLLGLGETPQRYATLRYALGQRFGMDGIDYRTMLHDDLTPGDVVAATILAADIQSTPQAVVEESLRTKTPIVDLANEHGMHAWPLEIFMGLVYLDYTDDPAKELVGASSSGTTGTI
ncbi:MAG TPA: M48 family metalloprotease [Candidatus Tyrphobacter sp.]